LATSYPFFVFFDSTQPILIGSPAAITENSREPAFGASRRKPGGIALGRVEKMVDNSVQRA
jgi:hypothetical protein